MPPRGSPPLHSRGQKPKWPTTGQGGYITLAALGIPSASERGTKSEVAHLWARWLHNPRSPPLQSVGQKQKWPTSGQGGYIASAASESASTSQRGTKSEVAHNWARWLHNPFRLGGHNQKWPTSGQGGYVTPAASGIPSASERVTKSEVAHKWARWLHNPCRLGDPSASERGTKSKVAHLWARWLHNPCRLGDPLRFRAGDKNRSGPPVGKVATQPLPPRGSPPLQSGGQNQKWPTSGQGGYITPAASRSPSASERGTKSKVAHLWARWLHNHRSPPLQSGGQKQKWPTSGQGGYVTPAASGIPLASERGTKSEVAHLRGRWLHNPCRLGDPLRFRAGDKIRSGPQVGKVAT